jgi:hypothetical protein
VFSDTGIGGWMELIQIVISAFVTIFSVGLFFVSIASFRKYKSFKLLFVSLVFLVFLIRGILLSVVLFFPNLAYFTNGSYGGVFDLMILLLLFVAVLKR